MKVILEHEQPVLALSEALHHVLASEGEGSRAVELREQLQAMEKSVFSSLSPEQRLGIARHPHRPRGIDLLGRIVTNVQELRGDRVSADDPAIFGALATIGQRRCMILITERGNSTEERIAHRFGMPMPSGFRKALRLMRLAARFQLPVISLVDTTGAYAGLEAEQGGQAWAIAESLQGMLELPTPIVSVILGEGCSGGALALAIADSFAILEHAYFSVIAPEGCASILWRDRQQAGKALKALRIQSEDLHEYGIVDEILPEPIGGAHRDSDQMAQTLQQYLLRELDRWTLTSIEKLIERRQQRALKIGMFSQESCETTTAAHLSSPRQLS